MTIKLAFDKSMRTIDKDGRMHVALSNISKAAVNPYRGNEIPEYASLGLNPDRVYYLLRDPAELAKGAATFNNIQVLDRHIPVNAVDPQKDKIVGSTGTDCVFNDPFLQNSLVLWDAVAIAGVTTRIQCELSCAYYYDADMTPGTFKGVAYDGIMRNIKGNHVALVEVGRAGPDVMVGDSKLLEIPPVKKLSTTAIAVRAALMAYLGPKLAQDAQIKDLTAIVGTVKAATFAQDKPAIIAAVVKKFGDKLAKDADLADLAGLLDAFSGDDLGADDADAVPPAAATPKAEDASPSDQLMALLKGAGLSSELMEQATALCAQMAPAAATDEFPPADKDKDKDKVDKTAMDAAIAAAVSETEAKTVKRMQAISVAEKAVLPIIGAVAAMDSAESVYKLALDHAKVDLTDVHPSAYRAMVALIQRPSATPAPRLGMDSAGIAGFETMFPNAGKMKGGV